MDTYSISNLYTKTLLSMIISSAFYTGYSQAVDCNRGVTCKNADDHVSSAIADGVDTSLIFTSPDVTVDRSYNGISGIRAKNQANIIFEGNASIVSTDPNSEISRAIAVNIESGAHVTVKDNFIAEIKSIDLSPGIVKLNNGQLSIGKDLQIHLLAGSDSGFGLYLGGSSKVVVGGKAVLRNHSSSDLVINFSVQNSSTAKFNQLESISNNDLSVAVGGTANLITEGETLIENASSDGDGLWFNGASLISLGDSQVVADDMMAKRAGIAQLNVGNNATIKTNEGDAIYVLAGASDSVTTVKGAVISNGNAYNVSLSSSKNHELNIVNGNVIGDVQFNSGNDRFYIHSGMLNGDVKMGDGDDDFKATGGKIKGSVYLGSGHNSALLANHIDTSELTSLTGSSSNSVSMVTSGALTLSNINFDGYSLSGGTGTLLSDWDSIHLKDQTTMTITGGYLETKSALNIDSTSTLQATETGHSINLTSASSTINNAGHIKIANNSVGERWHILGNYHGEDGLISMNTVLNGDDSLTDKLSINGDTSGMTYVKVNNVGGRGDLTDRGIELITVDGESNGMFKKQNNTRIVAGLYEYDLVQKGKNWYLTSELVPTPPPMPGPEAEKEHLYRPESGSYLGNIAAANSLFNLRLEDREGRAENSSLWLRQVGSHTRYRDTSNQLHNQTNRYVIQGGGEIYSTQFAAEDHLGLGVMVGYGKASTNTASRLSGYSSRGEVDGYNAGLYATWYQDANTLNGAYIDSWINYSWLDATVNGEKLSTENYNINGYSASLESGYRMPVYQGLNSNVFITPQAQITWNGLEADDHTESNGTKVQSGGSDNLQTRLGLKISRDGISDIDKGSDKLFTVYAEANWLYNSKPASATLNGERVSQTGSRNTGELKLGTEGQVNKNFNLWTNVAQQIGTKGYSDTSVNIGVKYRF